MSGRSPWGVPGSDPSSGAGAVVLDSAPGARGRVLVVGRGPKVAELLTRLAGMGFQCGAADGGSQLLGLARDFKPEAILFTDPQRDALEVIRGDAVLRQLPVIADLSGGQAEALRRLSFDDWVHSPDELTGRLESALKARRLVERDVLARQRMETLLELSQAATSSLELDQILTLAVKRIAEVVASDRCSIILVEGTGSRLAQVVASREEGNLPLQIDLARYPELRRALETRQPVHVEDASSDPLMEGVREHIQPLGVKSVLVQPLVCQDDLLGALFLRLSREDGAFAREDQEFARTVAAAIANSVRNA